MKWFRVKLFLGYIDYRGKKRLVLKAVNKKCNEDIIHHFPIYNERINKPSNILSRALILSLNYRMRTRGKCNLWICAPSGGNNNIGEGCITKGFQSLYSLKVNTTIPSSCATLIEYFLSLYLLHQRHSSSMIYGCSI